MSRSTQVIGGCVALGTVVALVWFKAPIVPALVGAIGAGLILYWRARRRTNQP